MTTEKEEHTPLPWRLGLIGETSIWADAPHHTYSTIDGHPVLDRRIGEFDQRSFDPAENRANARLSLECVNKHDRLLAINAELLAVLEDVLSGYDKCLKDNNVSHLGRGGVFVRVASAIARAKGETE